MKKYILKKERIISMKFRIAILALMCLFMARCATYYRIFSYNEPKSTFYTGGEKAILEKTVKSLDFDYGYDPALDLDYVVPLTEGFSEFRAGEGELARALADVDGRALADYNDKLYRLKKITLMKLEQCREDRIWKNYTFINKYLLPPLEYYSGLIEKQAIKRNSSYAREIDNRKRAVDESIEFEMRRKEFNDLWENDYNL